MTLRKLASIATGGALPRSLHRLNARHPWNHNDYFHGWILANVPTPCTVALDVGCGHGGLVAALATYEDRVIGNDIDEAMRAAATRRCAGLTNVTITGDPWTRGDEPLDLVTMIAVLHHLDVPAALEAVRRRLRPGGRFLAVGFAPPVSLTDQAWDAASTFTNPIIGYITHPWPHRTGETPQPPMPVREPTLSFAQLRELLDSAMPGATLRHRVGFRHTIAWTKPTDDPAPPASPTMRSV